MVIVINLSVNVILHKSKHTHYKDDSITCTCSCEIGSFSEALVILPILS